MHPFPHPSTRVSMPLPNQSGRGKLEKGRHKPLRRSNANTTDFLCQSAQRDFIFRWPHFEVTNLLCKGSCEVCRPPSLGHPGARRSFAPICRKNCRRESAGLCRCRQLLDLQPPPTCQISQDKWLLGESELNAAEHVTVF